MKRSTRTSRGGASTPPRADPKSGNADHLDLMALVDSPDVRLLMHADHVDRAELIDMLNKVRLELRSRSNGDTATNPHDDDRYRAGVGIVLMNSRNQVFIGQRSDVDHDAWQMPQGGIDPGETPRDAALRELKEEIGTDDVVILAEGQQWLYYHVPQELAQRAWGGRWIGQRQKWFVMLFKGSDEDIDIATEHPEFRTWRWIDAGALTDIATPFKRELYDQVFGQFATYFRD